MEVKVKCPVCRWSLFMLQRRSMPRQLAQILNNSVFQCQATQVLPGADHLCRGVSWFHIRRYASGTSATWPLVPPANPQAQVIPGHLGLVQTLPLPLSWLQRRQTRQLQGFPRRVCYSASAAVVLYQPARASDLQPDPTKPCKHEQWRHLFRV